MTALAAAVTKILNEPRPTHTSTISAMINGTRKRPPSQTLVDAVAQALGEDPRTVAAWVGLRRTVREPYRAPDVASLFTQRQQNAITELIAAFAEELVGDDRKPAPMTTTGTKPDAPADSPPAAGHAPATPPGPDATGPGAVLGREEPSKRHGRGPTRGGGRR